MPRKLLVGGLQRNGSVKGVKKVSPPTVPTLSVKAAHYKPQRSSPCICNGDEQLTLDFDSDSDCTPHNGKPPRSPSNGSNHYSPPFYNSHITHPMKKMTPGGGSNGQIHLAHVIVHSQPDSLPSTPSDAGHSPSLSKGRLLSGTQASLEDQGIDMNSPGRHSPGGSSGGSSISRHSLSSLDSGRASGPGSETGKVVNRRLSIQSYEGSSPQRRSYHSSSSSIASVGDELGQGPNVAEMVLHGLPDVEILTNWLTSLHFEEYIPLFLLAGYDMPTITRMTPEDLTAIGITKPNHRRKLKAEIAKLNISDGIPEYKPDSLLEWLQLLRLEEYFDTLCQQNFNTVDKVTDLTWEDLEDIGIQKLGHQKRILLAIKRIEDINQGRRPNLHPQPSYLPSHMDNSIGGAATFPRPSTLNTAQPYQYPCQEIAISTHRPKSSPSTDSIPEMKTFQQSPIREESLFLQALHNSAQNIASSQNHNGTLNTIISPTRGRSLESLSSENPISCGSSVPPAASVMSYAPSSQSSAAITSYNSQTLATVTSYIPNSQPSAAVSSYTPNSQPPAPASSFTLSSQAPAAVTSYAPTSYASSSQPPAAVTSYAPTSYAPSSQPPAAVTSYAPSSQPLAAVTSYAPSSHLSAASEQSKSSTKDWRITDLDSDFDYECEGTATLNRPKGLVRLKPMAKITAKTREEIAEAIMDIPDSEFKSLINQSRTLDGWSSLDGSPRHGPATVPRSATLKRAPPPPPKRSNSTKGEKPPVEIAKKDEQLSAMKQLMDQSVKPLSKISKDNEPSEDFPPPPSPLPSVVDDKTGKAGEKTEQMDELFNNPLFRQRRKDSAESSSSIDSSALPFANETVGTIKQKSSKPYPALPMESSLASNQRDLATHKGKQLSESNTQEHEYDVTPEAISPGDVIDDIEHMLANLSDQLDAMLDDEQVQK